MAKTQKRVWRPDRIPALDISFRPAVPELRIRFDNHVLIRRHDGVTWHDSGMFYRGSRVVFEARDIPPYTLSADQQRFLDAIMLARAGVYEVAA